MNIIKMYDYKDDAIIMMVVMVDAKVGTPYWMAPEVILSGELDSQEYDQRADVWS